jgi:hypothetical protein
MVLLLTQRKESLRELFLRTQDESAIAKPKQHGVSDTLHTNWSLIPFPSLPCDDEEKHSPAAEQRQLRTVSSTLFQHPLRSPFVIHNAKFNDERAVRATVDLSFLDSFGKLSLSRPQETLKGLPGAFEIISLDIWMDILDMVSLNELLGAG